MYISTLDVVLWVETVILFLMECNTTQMFYLVNCCSSSCMLFLLMFFLVFCWFESIFNLMYCMCLCIQPKRSMIGEAQGPSDEKIAVVSVDDCDTALSLRFGLQLGNYSCAAQGKQTSSKKWVPSFASQLFLFYVFMSYYMHILWTRRSTLEKCL